MTSEIHISGEIDNLLFGYLKDPYYAELEKSINCFHVAQQTPDDFLKIFFSLFLENDIFSEDTNLQKFEKSIDIVKLERYCPNFFAIYQTILPQEETERTLLDTSGQENPNPFIDMIHDTLADLEKETGMFGDEYTKKVQEREKRFDEPMVKTEKIRSTTYTIHSFLEEILDSPSHPSQNTNPSFDNQLRMFNGSHLIEFYEDGQKIEESTLEEFFKKNNSFEKDIDFEFDEEKKFIDFDEDTIPNNPDHVRELTYKLLNELSPTINFRNKIYPHKDGSMYYEYAVSIHFINFFFGNLEGLKDPANYPNYWWEYKKIRYRREREVRVQFYNVSKMIYKIPNKIDRSKLAFLNYSGDWVRPRFENIFSSNSHYNFNYLAYDGIMIKPEEIFYRDKGILIDLTRKEPSRVSEESLPDLWALQVD